MPAILRGKIDGKEVIIVSDEQGWKAHELLPVIGDKDLPEQEWPEEERFSTGIKLVDKWLYNE